MIEGGRDGLAVVDEDRIVSWRGSAVGLHWTYVVDRIIEFVRAVLLKSCVDNGSQASESHFTSYG